MCHLAFFPAGIQNNRKAMQRFSAHNSLLGPINTMLSALTLPLKEKIIKLNVLLTVYHSISV
jgi:hypothetical protein